MSAISENNGAWILSPYCFCADRPWLSVSDVWGKDIDDKDNVGGGMTRIFGLSNEDSALLLSLLTALAVFLFLLFLLLCLFCPCCLCCRKMCPCCFKGKASNKAMPRGSSAHVGKVVNLTAVDMRIPRVWTDGNPGFSDSELGRRRNIWQKTTGGKGMEYAGINAVKTGNAQHNAWVSDYGFGDEQGNGYKRFTGMTERNKGKKERNSDMVALNEFYHDTSKTAPSTLRHRSNSYSSIIEKLMTPRSTGHLLGSGYNSIIQSRGIAGGDTVKHSSYDYFGTGGQSGDQAVVVKEAEDAEKMKGVLHSTANRNFTSSAVNSKTDDSVQNISTQTASARTSGYDSAVDNSRAEPIEVNSVAIASSATMGNNSDFLKETFVTRETCNPSYNLITEKSSYMKRVVEETETITTG